MTTENERPSRDALWQQACGEYVDRVKRASRYVHLLMEHGYLDDVRAEPSDDTLDT